MSIILSAVLHEVSPGRLAFWCDGCHQTHEVPIGVGPGPRWTWDGNAVQPTFLPSIRVRGIRADLTEKESNELEAMNREAQLTSRFATVCHSFVEAGMIRYLSDSTHWLSGQTVALPAFP